MAVRQGAKASEEFSKGNQFADRLKYLNWQKDVESNPQGILVRFITGISGWPVVDTHMFVPTKDKPAKWTSDNWPGSMPAVCALDQLFYDDEAMTAKFGADQATWPSPGSPDAIYQAGFGKCYIHDHYADRKDKFGRPYSSPQTMTYALLVLRDRTSDGKGIRDKMEKWKTTEGAEIDVPAFRAVSSQWAQLFSGVAAGAFEDDSVNTKDFLLKKKKGSSAEPSPLSVTRNHHPAVTENAVLGTAPATDSWLFYEAKLQDMGEAADLLADLRRQASEDHIHRWFEPGPWDEKDEDTEAADAASEAPKSELTPEQEEYMKSVRERLSKGEKTPVG